MKKLLLSIFCLIAFTGIQAQEITLDFTTNSWGLPEGSSNKAVSTAQFTNGGYTIELTGTSGAGYYFNSQGYLMLGKKGATLSLPAFDFAVSKIEFVGRKDASGNTLHNVYVAETAVSTEIKGCKETSTFEIAAEYQAAGNIYTLKINSAHNAQITQIKIYKADGVVTPEPEEPEQPGEGEGEEEEVEIEDIEVVLAAGAASNAKVQGTIIATYAKGFLLHDNTGDILVYLNNTHEYNVGDVVTVAGATSMYGGLLQFGSSPAVEKVGNTTVTEPTPATLDGSGLDAFLVSPSIRYVVYTGKLTISGNYYNVAVEGASTAIASIQYPNTGLVPAEYNNGTVKVTGYLIGFSGTKYVNTMATKVELIEEGEVEPEEPETPITGEILTVSQALAKYVDGQQVDVKVKGFIVGAMNSTGYVPEFGESGVYSNILLSDNADEDNIDNCLIIQLVSGTDIRAKLNMGDNPGNYKKEVIIEGSLEKYFQQAGIKNPTAAQFTGTTAIENVEAEAENAVIYDLTGRRIDEITEAGIYIINGVKKIVR